MRSVSRLSTAILFLLVSITLDSSQAQATSPGLSGRIAYVRLTDIGYDVFTADVDGTSVHRLLSTPSDEESMPSWSPDGSKIAFESGGGLLVVNADGTGQKTLVPGVGCGAANPTWFADGSRLLFADCTGLDSIAVDGTDRQEFLSDVFFAEFSPDGTKLLYSKYDGSDYDLYVADPNGSNPVPITDLAGDEFEADWSPDGGSIAFANSVGTPAEWEVYVVKSDGSNLANLTDRPGLDASPIWAPDGAKILFSSNRQAGADLFTMDPDGTDVEPLAVRSATGADWQPLWVDLSPSSTLVQYGQSVQLTAALAFTGSANQELTIWRQPVGGTESVVQTADVGADGAMSVVLPSLRRSTDFWASWTGDGDHHAAVSNRARVGVQAKAAVTLRRYYGSERKWRLYHVGRRVWQLGRVIPSHRGKQICFLSQIRRNGNWRGFAEGCFAQTADGRALVYLSGAGRGSYRANARFAGDADHVGRVSSWAYFRVTA